jgi:hypothetical protein
MTVEAALAKAVQGARHTPQQITWYNADGTAEDLSDAQSITGRIFDPLRNTVRDIDGTLTPVADATDHNQFDWEYGTNDLSEAGTFEVQFTATFSDGRSDKTFKTDWSVEPAV